MIQNDTDECERLVDDLRKILIKIDDERVRIIHSEATNQFNLKSKSKIKQSHGRINHALNKARDKADTKAFSFMLKDRVKTTVLVNGDIYKHCNINFTQRSLKALSFEVVRIIKYLKMQILGIASIGL